MAKWSAILTWQNGQKRSFLTVKEMVTVTPVLKHYNVKKVTTIQCNTSEKGLGASLLQNRQPITFASRALNKSKQNYAQIGKEHLPIVFAGERFNQYIHGKDCTTVHTDHRPLVPIFTKLIYVQCIKIITMNVVETTKVQSQSGIPTWKRDVHSRYAKLLLFK